MSAAGLVRVFAAQCEYVVWGSSGSMPLERGVGCLPGLVRHMPRRSEKRHIAGKTADTMVPLVRICEPGGLTADYHRVACEELAAEARAAA